MATELRDVDPSRFMSRNPWEAASIDPRNDNVTEGGSQPGWAGSSPRASPARRAVEADERSAALQVRFIGLFAVPGDAEPLGPDAGRPSWRATYSAEDLWGAG